MIGSVRTLMGTDAGQGILAPVVRLGTCLHVTLVLLTATSAVRYVQGHGLGDRASWVLGGAGLLLAVYAAYGRMAGLTGRQWPAVWCAALVATWFALVVIAPSFSWCAVPLAFVALRVLPFSAAAGVVAGMVVTVAAAWSQMQRVVDPTVVVGPACVAVLAVTAYQALEREAHVRQRLLDDLRDAQGDLATAEHQAGVLAERARLSREIHDSVAQGLSSINLLLAAADQDWEPRPATAREHVGQAARTARHALEEVRRVVRDLAPAELATDTAGTALPAALREVGARTAEHTGLLVEVAVHGEPVPLPDQVATALLRTARGALANVVEHAAARSATVTLTYQEEQVSLDVRDDGHGFDPGNTPAGGIDRGRGLAGIRDRALGGELVIERWQRIGDSSPPKRPKRRWPRPLRSPGSIRSASWTVPGTHSHPAYRRRRTRRRPRLLGGRREVSRIMGLCRSGVSVSSGVRGSGQGYARYGRR